MERVFAIESLQLWLRNCIWFGSSISTELFAEIFSVRKTKIYFFLVCLVVSLQCYIRKYFLFRKDTTTTYDEALIYAGGIVLLNALNAIVVNHHQHFAFHNALKTRVAVCSLIYRKTLRLSQTALGQTSSGNMINLLSNDVSRFEWALYLGNYIWIGPLFTCIVAWFLWFEIGIAGLIGIGILLTIVLFLSMFGFS